ncbi:Phage integrase [Streptococcus macedonicus]|uniref:tyrosine-type recombinase/integrase n=1 Tax=Streptococcus macedonicus TaxID=59310 RepID=UPI00081259A3|nr:site-specific integrase [Streptococcus macedonicus]SCA90060.1 Phage integrase [Streptococcus macedonicus]
MWIEELSNGKYKYFERYKDPYTEKWRKVSVTLESGSNRAKKEAQKLLNKKIDSKLEKLKTTDALFTTVFEEWLPIYKETIKKSSLHSTLATIKRIKKDFALEVPISNITPKYIQNYITSNDEWTYSQKYRIKSLLNVFFDYAVSLEIIENNPARKIVLNKPQKTIEELEAVENKYLEPDELNRLLKEFYRKPITYRYGLLSEFMSLNGCRIGEAAALKLKNYHKESKTIDIHGTLTKYDDNPTTPKTTASYRTVYLTDREVEILDEIISMNQLQEETNPKWKKSDFIFVTNAGNSVQSSVFAKSLQRANERLQKPIGKHISSHIFRHTMISMLAEYNIPLKAIMDRVGHSDSETTTKIYTHVTKNMKNKAVEVLNHIANNRQS